MRLTFTYIILLQLHYFTNGHEIRGSATSPVMACRRTISSLAHTLILFSISCCQLLSVSILNNYFRFLGLVFQPLIYTINSLSNGISRVHWISLYVSRNKSYHLTPTLQGFTYNFTYLSLVISH